MATTTTITGTTKTRMNDVCTMSTDVESLVIAPLSMLQRQVRHRYVIPKLSAGFAAVSRAEILLSDRIAVSRREFKFFAMRAS